MTGSDNDRSDRGVTDGEVRDGELTDGERFAAYGDELTSAIVRAAPDWVRQCVSRRLPESAPDGSVDDAQLQTRINEAGQLAAVDVGEQLRSLLQRDVDRQWTNPLSIIRTMVKYPAEVLSTLGVSAPHRPDDAVRMFPDDTYDLTPANFAEFGPEAHECGIRWGAAKAHLHLRRHKNLRIKHLDDTMIVAHIPNLFDRSRFSGTVTFVDDPAQLVELSPTAVIVDLDRCDDPAAFLVPGALNIGFGPHVDAAAHQRARDLGYNTVLARSVFFRGLDDLLAGLIEPGSDGSHEDSSDESPNTGVE